MYAPEKKIIRILLVGIILFSLIMVIIGAYEQDQTSDEHNHYNYSQKLWEHRNSDRVAFFVTTTPIIMLNVLTQKLVNLFGPGNENLFVKRLPGSLWFLLLIVIVFFFIKSRYGERSACLVCAAIALDSNLIAHSTLITVDIAYTFATIAVLFSIIKLVETPKISNGLLVGFIVGLAFCTKVTVCVLLVSCFLTLFLLVLFSSSYRKRILVAAYFLPLILSVFFVTVSAGYLFVNVGYKPSEFGFKSQTFKKISSIVPDWPIPMPKDSLLLVDMLLPKSFTKKVGRKAEKRTIVLGKRREGGVWYYFIFTWFLKTPVMLILATIVGIFFSLKYIPKHFSYRFLAINSILHIVYFSFFFHNQIGYRYALMWSPLLYLCCIPGWKHLSNSKRTPLFLLVIVLVTVSEHIFYVGNPLSFTNVVIQPKKDVYKLITDSNIDWGQNNVRINRWISEEGIESTHLNPQHILKGHNTIQLNALAGVYNFEQYKWVRENLTPEGHIGHTHLTYQVTDQVFERFLSETRLVSPNNVAKELCASNLNSSRESMKSGMQLYSNASAFRTWQICLQLATDSNVSFVKTNAEGSLVVAPLDDKGACVANEILVEKDQEVWFRFKKGVHALCIKSNQFGNGNMAWDSSSPSRLSSMYHDQ